MADFKSSFSGPQIDEAVAKALSVDPRGNGWIKLDSTPENPLSLNTIKNPGNYTAMNATDIPMEIDGISPVNFSILYGKGELLQLIIVADAMFLRTFNDTTKEWNSTWTVERSSSYIEVSGSSTTPPINPEENAIWIYKGENNTYTMKIFSAGEWHEVGQDGLMSASVYDPTNQRSDLYTLIDSKFAILVTDKDKILAHIADTTIHTTAEEKTSWSQKVTKTEFETAKTELKTSLDTKIDADTAAAGTTSTETLAKVTTLTGTMDTHMADNTSHVTAAQTTDWDSKAPGNHSHIKDGKVEIDASKVVSGVLDIARIPAAAIEDVTEVADMTAMYALTKTQVQNGDTVFVQEGKKFYYVVDDTKLDVEAGYKLYSTGMAESITWENVKNRPTTIAGYGITDAYTKTEVNGKITEAAGNINDVLSNYTRTHSRTLYLKKRISFHTGLNAYVNGIQNGPGVSNYLGLYKNNGYASYHYIVDNHRDDDTDCYQVSPYVCLPVYDAPNPTILYVGQNKNETTNPIVTKPFPILSPKLNGLTLPNVIVSAPELRRVRKIKRFVKWNGTDTGNNRMEQVLLGLDCVRTMSGGSVKRDMCLLFASTPFAKNQSSFNQFPTEIESSLDIFGNTTLLNHDIKVYNSDGSSGTVSAGNFLRFYHVGDTDSILILDFEVDEDNDSVILMTLYNKRIYAFVCKIKYSHPDTFDTIVSDLVFNCEHVMRFLDPTYGIEVSYNDAYTIDNVDASIERLTKGVFRISIMDETTGIPIENKSLTLLHSVKNPGTILRTYELRKIELNIPNISLEDIRDYGWIDPISTPRIQYFARKDILFMNYIGGFTVTIADLKKKLNMDEHIEKPTDYTKPLFRSSLNWPSDPEELKDFGFTQFLSPTEFSNVIDVNKKDSAADLAPLEIASYFNNVSSDTFDGTTKYGEIKFLNEDLFFVFSPDLSIFGTFGVERVDGNIQIVRKNLNVSKYPKIEKWSYFNHSLFSWDFLYQNSDSGSAWEQALLGNSTFDIYQITEQGFTVWECAEIGGANIGISTQLDNLHQKVESLTIGTGSIWTRRETPEDAIRLAIGVDKSIQISILDYIPGPNPYNYHVILVKAHYASPRYYLGYVTDDSQYHLAQIFANILPIYSKPAKLANAVINGTKYKGPIKFTGCGVLVATSENDDGSLTSSNQSVGYIYIESILDFCNKNGNIPDSSFKTFSTHPNFISKKLQLGGICVTAHRDTTDMQNINISMWFTEYTSANPGLLNLSGDAERATVYQITDKFGDNATASIGKSEPSSNGYLGGICVPEGSFSFFKLDSTGYLEIITPKTGSSVVTSGKYYVCSPSESATFKDRFSLTDYYIYSAYEDALMIGNTDIYVFHAARDASQYGDASKQPLSGEEFPHNLPFDGTTFIYKGCRVIPTNSQRPIMLVEVERNDGGSTSQCEMYVNSVATPGIFRLVYSVDVTELFTSMKYTSYAQHIALERNASMSEYNDLTWMNLNYRTDCFTNMNAENPNIIAKVIADAFKYRNVAKMLAVQSEGIYKSTCDAVDNLKNCIDLL